jgi:transcription elongation factor/antiterminator RfaH
MLNNMKWYALYLRSRYEQKAHEELRKKGIESFLPLIEVTRIWSDRKKKIKEPLFHGYLFVKTDLGNRIDIVQTNGVVRLVGIGERPSPIPEEQINWIRLLTEHPAKIQKENYISIGQKVRVAAGMFAGLEGFVMKDKSPHKVVVTIESIKQSVSLEIPSEMLEMIE